LRAKKPKDTPEDLAGVSEAIFIRIYGTFKKTGKDGDDALVDVEVDIVTLSRQLKH
jgi:hypothetical protein